MSHTFNNLLLKMTLANDSKKLISGIYIDYPKMDLFVDQISINETTHVFKDKTRFAVYFPQKNAYFAPQCEQNTILQIWILIHWLFQVKRGW